MIASFESWLHSYAPAAEWAVAIGTALLAAFTYYLGKQAKREAAAVAEDSKAVREQSQAVREQVELQRHVNETATRPYVYAAATPTWSKGEQDHTTGLHWYQYLPVTNGGLGPAIGIGGRLEQPDNPQQLQLIPTTLPPGASGVLLLEGELGGGRERWDGKNGELWYHDIHGREWRSSFTVWWNGALMWIDSAAIIERAPD